MTMFDQLSFYQRSYAIQQLQTMLDELKEFNLRDQLIEQEHLTIIGMESETIKSVEDKILNFAINHFGVPFSYEAKELDEDEENDDDQ